MEKIYFLEDEKRNIITKATNNNGDFNYKEFLRLIEEAKEIKEQQLLSD